MDEIEPVPGDIKIYTHEEHFIQDSNKNTMLLRCSFDEERLFIRSACILKPVQKIDGLSYRFYPIKDIELSNIGEEVVNE